ncbi:MAG: hypothetical protein AABX23_02535 [Nanoarchaeota archaeon]
MGIKNRKGIFFTLIVIAAISLFLISYTFYSNYGERGKTHDRINTLNTFIFSIEENLERQIFISGFRSLFVMQTESIEQGAYIQNATYSLNELFFNGSYNNVEQPIMIGATFSDIQDEIQQKANKVNAYITLNNPSISLTQSDPWNIDIIFNVNLDAQDQGRLVTWNKTQSYISKIPIKDFEDPLYLLSTGGTVTNRIEKTPFANFSNGSSLTNLNSHITNRYYKSNSQAPSYLNRLQGSNAASEFGIESLIHIPQLSNQGINIQDKTVVDYIYFSISTPISCRITGMPSWFKIDQAHLTDYQLNGLEHSCN